ncbi:MAG: hypothetical protein ACPF9T_10970 [Pseudomonadales bacterium]
MLRLGKWIALGSVAFASFSAQAASWALDEDASSVHFVTVKNSVNFLKSPVPSRRKRRQ